MSGDTLNRLTEGLGRLCSERPVDIKWIIAPSLRVGYQWLEAVARSGRPVLNAHVKTLEHLSLELALPEMGRKGLKFATPLTLRFMVDRAFGRLRGGPGRYLSSLEPGEGVTGALLGAVRDLRAAGIDAGDLQRDSFEVEEKGDDVGSLLGMYEEELSKAGLVDQADILRMAAALLKRDPLTLPDDLAIAIPEDHLSELWGLRRALWESIPHEKRKVLPVDGPRDESSRGRTDAALLGWIAEPDRAPVPAGDGTAHIFRAVAVVGEVREALRRCVRSGIPLDDVEMIHTDTGAYVPVIFETMSRLFPGDMEEIPVTFYEGLPVWYSRPARALIGWLFWTGEGFPQSVLIRMMQDGLVRAEAERDGTPGHAALASVLRSLPIGAGRERYLGVIDGAIAELDGEESGPAPGGDGGEGETALRRIETRRRALAALRGLVAALLDCAPENLEGRPLLEGAATFLKERARSASRFDEYARVRMLDNISELESLLDEGEPPAGLDVRGWLYRLALELNVGGQGPTPGCLYVAPLEAGGHSGRAHTFVVGLDDGRFPGKGRQDPVLLDAERARLSEELPTAGGSAAREIEGLARLLSGLRGEVTLGYCCRDVLEDRDMFPGPAVTAAYRILSGDRQGALENMNEWLPVPASFATDAPGLALDRAEWWVSRMCAGEPVADPRGLLSRFFPALRAGFAACEARRSDRFTEYDGHVPEAGLDLDPRLEGGVVLSASALETLGRCPLEYFFRYVLGIVPPVEYEPDPGRWLEPSQRGELLHAVFRDFMRRLGAEGLSPSLERDRGLIEEILHFEIENWKKKDPPPRGDVFEREVRDLKRTVDIFLMEEERYRDGDPRYFEACIGIPSASACELDCLEPVAITLDDDFHFRARGRLDRVDALKGVERPCFLVWDYKTGSSSGYDRADPFREGRTVQGALYMLVAEERLGELHAGAKVTAFGYYFPGLREHGERIVWSRPVLSAGRWVLGRLCEMIAGGVFPFSDSPDDVAYSDFLPAFPEVEMTARAVKVKLENPDNVALRPFAALRGRAAGGEGDDPRG